MVPCVTMVVHRWDTKPLHLTSNGPAHGEYPHPPLPPPPPENTLTPTLGGGEDCRQVTVPPPFHPGGGRVDTTADQHQQKQTKAYWPIWCTIHGQALACCCLPKASTLTRIDAHHVRHMIQAEISTHCSHPSFFPLHLLLNRNSVKLPPTVPKSLELPHMFRIGDRDGRAGCSRLRFGLLCTFGCRFGHNRCH